MRGVVEGSSGAALPGQQGSEAPNLQFPNQECLSRLEASFLQRSHAPPRHETACLLPTTPCNFVQHANVLVLSLLISSSSPLLLPLSIQLFSGLLVSCQYPLFPARSVHMVKMLQLSYHSRRSCSRMETMLHVEPGTGLGVPILQLSGYASSISTAFYISLISLFIKLEL